MPRFFTQYDEHPRVHQTLGSREKVLYTSKVLDDGTIDLIESGKEDLYGYIQSHKDSVDINVLLARYQNGDPTALARVQGSYGDFTQMPKTYAELLNAMIAGEQYFNSLPVETRAKFDHDFNKFMAGMDDMPGWLEKMGIKAQQDVQEPAELVPVDQEGVENA